MTARLGIAYNTQSAADETGMSASTLDKAIRYTAAEQEAINMMDPQALIKALEDAQMRARTVGDASSTRAEREQTQAILKKID